MKTAQFGKERRTSSVCVLCGDAEPDTGEHIPPRSIFLKKPEQYLVVPACHECNNSTKLDDDYLRQVMSGASHTDEAIKVWKEKVRPQLRDFPRTRAGLAKELLTREIEFPSGVVLPVDTYSASPERLNRILQKMVRGLHWFHSGRILPKETTFGCNFYNIIDVSKCIDDARWLSIFKRTTPGVYRTQKVMKTFFYTGAICGGRSLWFFFFYRQNMMDATTDSSQLTIT